MSYYDNVKDDVEDKGDSSKPNFDTLRQAAEEHSENEDKQEGDDTEIEVLEEGGLSNQKTSTQAKQKTPQNKQQKQRNQEKQRPQNKTIERGKKQQNNRQSESLQREQSIQEERSKNNDISCLEDKMDKMIEQNKKIIQILESFGN